MDAGKGAVQKEETITCQQSNTHKLTVFSSNRENPLNENEIAEIYVLHSTVKLRLNIEWNTTKFARIQKNEV